MTDLEITAVARAIGDDLPKNWGFCVREGTADRLVISERDGMRYFWIAYPMKGGVDLLGPVAVGADDCHETVRKRGLEVFAEMRAVVALEEGRLN